MNLLGDNYMTLALNQAAPNFTLFDTEIKERSLSEFLGGKLVLAFVPAAFTGVCTKELCTFRDSLSELNQLNAKVVAISVDAPFSNKEFAKVNQFNFPILSDYTRSVSKQYGGVHEDFIGIKGFSVAKRAVYVLDSKGVVKYAWVSENPGAEPNYGEIKAALESF